MLPLLMEIFDKIVSTVHAYGSQNVFSTLHMLTNNLFQPPLLHFSSTAHHHLASSILGLSTILPLQGFFMLQVLRGIVTWKKVCDYKVCGPNETSWSFWHVLKASCTAELSLKYALALLNEIRLVCADYVHMFSFESVIYEEWAINFKQTGLVAFSFYSDSLYARNKFRGFWYIAEIRHQRVLAQTTF